MWEAARRGRLAAVQWLIEQGAELDATGCYNSESMGQLTPDCAAVYYRRAEVAAYLLARGARLGGFPAAFIGGPAPAAPAAAAEAWLLLAGRPVHPTQLLPL